MNTPRSHLDQACGYYGMDDLAIIIDIMRGDNAAGFSAEEVVVAHARQMQKRIDELEQQLAFLRSL